MLRNFLAPVLFLFFFFALPANAQQALNGQQIIVTTTNNTPAVQNNDSGGFFDPLTNFVSDTFNLVTDVSGFVYNNVITDTLSERWQENVNNPECWMCDLTGKAIQISEYFAVFSYEITSDIVRPLAFYFFGIWFGWKTIQLLAGLSPFGRIWLDMIKGVIIFAFISLAITTGRPGNTGAETWWEYVYKLPMISSVEVHTAILDKMSRFADDESDMPMPEGQECGDFTPLPIGPGNRNIQTVLGHDKIKEITCSVHKIQTVNNIGLQFGIYSANPVHSITEFVRGLSVGVAGGGLADLPGNILSFILEMVTRIGFGLFLAVIYFFSTVYFGALLLDLFVRISIISAFAPILIVATIFPMTRSWFFGALRGVFNAALTFMIISAVVGFQLTLLSYLPEYASESITPSGTGASAHLANMTTFTQFAEAISDNHINIEIRQQWVWYMIFCGLLAISMAKKIIGVVNAILPFEDSGISEVVLNKTKQAAMMAGAAGAAIGIAAPAIVATAGAAGVGGAALLGGKALGMAGAKTTGAALSKTGGAVARAGAKGALKSSKYGMKAATNQARRARHLDPF